MKVNEVTVMYKRTVQMRQFEPAEVSVMIKAQVDPTDQAKTVIASVRKLAREEIEIERSRLLNERIESVENEKEKSV